MNSTVQLDLPEDVFHRASQLAQTTDRTLSEVLLDWIQRGAADDSALNLLSDDAILELSNAMLPNDLQEELSNLLAEQREDILVDSAAARLDELMLLYRRTLIRKAAALKVAVQRGLRPPLDAA